MPGFQQQKITSHAKRTRAIYDQYFHIIKQELKITMNNTIKALLKKVDNVQEMGDVSREMEAKRIS